MYTSYDKAIVAIVMGILSIISLWTGHSTETAAINDAIQHAPTLGDVASSLPKVLPQVLPSIVPPVVSSVLAAVTPLLVYLIPNKH